MTRDIYATLEARRIDRHRAKWERACQRHKRAALGLYVRSRPWWTPLRRMLPWD